MQKSSKIICLGIVVSLLTFVMPMGLRPFVFLAGPIIIAYGIYSKGPEFREFNRKSYLAMMIGIFLFVLSFLIMWLLGSMMSTPYVPSIFALLILAAICLIIYGISSRKRQPSGEGWEAELEKSGRAGSFKEKNFVVPYTPEDSYAAMNETAKKLAYGKVFEKDDESKSLLFGVQQTFVARNMNFKGYAVIEPTEPNSSKVFIKIKRAGAEAAMEDILNAFTEVLEENYTKSTTDESLIEKNKDVDQSVDTAIYGSDEYNKTKNMYAKQRSAWSGVYALIIGMLMCFAGLSGQFVLRGTNSSEALVGVSLLVIIYGIYRLIRGAM